MRTARILTIASLFLALAAIAIAATHSVPLATTEDGRFDPAPYHGNVVYVDFWASWCDPCRNSFPWMDEMQRRYGDRGLVVVAINVDADPDRARAFLEELKPSFSVAWDTDKRLAAAHKLGGMPASFVYDREGKLRATHVGFRDRDRAELEATIRSLLGVAAGVAPGAGGTR